jgi:hypothetical protein
VSPRICLGSDEGVEAFCCLDADPESVIDDSLNAPIFLPVHLKSSVCSKDMSETT